MVITIATIVSYSKMKMATLTWEHGSWNDVYDIHWFQVLELEMDTSVIKNEGLISIDDELGTWSCFVELHRNGVSYFFIIIIIITIWKRFINS